MSDIQIPGFEMREKLGAGGWATVWKARQISLDRIVAIKVLSPHFAKDPADVQRFQAEAQAAARLKHPGIVQVYDAGMEGGCYFLVMEYVAGYTVGDWARRKRVLSEDDALLVADCVAEALQHAWKTAGIIHCDIKPDNIIVDADGTVKVADMGLARTMNVVGGARPNEEVMGTPAYMSPEQVRGDASLDFRTDIYAVGAMLYYLLTGKLLFDGHPDEKVMDLQITGTVPDPIELNASLSPAICGLIEKMLAKDPAARHRLWDDVREDIVRVKKHQPIREPLPEGALSTVRRSAARRQAAAPPPSAPPPPRKTTSSAGWRLGVGIVIAALVITAISRWLYVLPQQSVAPAPPPSPPRAVPSEPTVDETKISEMYDFAVKWAQEHPDLYEAAERYFSEVAGQAGVGKYQLMAQEQIRALHERRDRAAEEIVRRLDQEAARSVNAQEYLRAAELYETYGGPLAAETKEARAKKAKALKDKQQSIEDAQHQRQQEMDAKFGAFMGEVAARVVGGGAEAARDLLSGRVDEPEFSGHREEMLALRKVLNEAARIDQRVLDSFASQQDQEVTVQLKDGTRKTVVIAYVKDETVHVRLPTKVSAVTVRDELTLGDLALAEKLMRMGADDQPEVALVKGLIALKAGAYPAAAKYFAGTHPLLAQRLKAQADAGDTQRLEQDAEEALCRLAGKVGLTVEKFEEEAWMRVLQAQRPSPETAEKARRDLERFEEKFGRTAMAQKAGAFLKAFMEKLDRASAPKPKPQLLSATPREREAKPGE